MHGEPKFARSDLVQILHAAEFSIRAHEKQHRKYTGEPYVVHPASVAKILAADGASPILIQAGYLHDTVEDTRTLPSDIEREFGRDVLRLVMQVTKITRPDETDRVLKASRNHAHYAQASPEGQTLKLADRLDNLRTVVARSGSFAKLYMLETRDLLTRLPNGSPRLYAEVKRIVDEFFAIEERKT